MKINLNQDELTRLSAEIMDIFEDFLQDKNIKIPNKERDEYEADKGTEKAILFGSDYYSTEDKIQELIKKFLKDEWK